MIATFIIGALATVAFFSIGLLLGFLLTPNFSRRQNDDDGGPEADRLIAEAMRAWRADVAGRIVRSLETRGLLVLRRSGTSAEELREEALHIVAEDLAKEEASDA